MIRQPLEEVIQIHNTTEWVVICSEDVERWPSIKTQTTPRHCRLYSPGADMAHLYNFSDLSRIVNQAGVPLKAGMHLPDVVYPCTSLCVVSK